MDARCGIQQSAFLLIADNGVCPQAQKRQNVLPCNGLLDAPTFVRPLNPRAMEKFPLLGNHW